MGLPRDVQRSFRLSATTARLLDREAERSHESRNAFTDRLLGEALRLVRHPLIHFVEGATGHRRPTVIGSRLSVHQVIATLRGHDDSVDEAASYFGLPPRLVRAALDYYVDFRDEVDRDAAVADRAAGAERDRFDRLRNMLG